MNKKTYTGSKIQNHFTAYLIQFVRGKRHDYLEKKIQMADAEELLEDIGQMEARIVIEELLENQTREQLLLQEAQGKYPEWNKMLFLHSDLISKYYFQLLRYGITRMDLALYYSCRISYILITLQN